MTARPLDGWTVPRNGMGRRRWREHVLDELAAAMDAPDPLEIEAEASRLLCEDAFNSRPRARHEAERRLRLGQAVGRIVEGYGLEVEQTEINRAMIQEARRRRPVEADVVGFFRSDWPAMTSVLASIYEAKAFNFVFEKVGAA